MGGYYGEPLRGERGVTQWESLLPTIFNVVVDTVVCYWEYLMEEGTDRGDRSCDEATHPERRAIRVCGDGQRRTEEGLNIWEAILYEDDGMLDSTNPGWLQTIFDTLTGLFEQVGLKKNSEKPWRWSTIHAGWTGYGQTNPTPSR